MLQADPPFAPCVKHFTQESTQVGDRIQVVSSGSTGIIGCTKSIHDGVMEVVTQSPKQHLRLTITVALCDLMPHFQTGDHVKDHWSDRIGIVITIDHDSQTVTFLEKDTSTGIDTSFQNVQFYDSTPQFFQFTLGLFVEFPGAGGSTRCGCILQSLDSSAQVMDEMDGEVLQVDVKENDLVVLGVQATPLPRPMHCHIWEGWQVVVIKGSFKGYCGLVKAEDLDSVNIELDARLAYWNAVWTHWLFAKILQEAVGEQCILFYIRGVPPLSPHAKFEGLTAKTVPAARQKVQPELNEVVVHVVHQGRAIQISINPSCLIPWALAEGNKVVIVGYRWIGQVGKLVKLDHRCCVVVLALSGEKSYFTEGDIMDLGLSLFIQLLISHFISHPSLAVHLPYSMALKAFTCAVQYLAKPMQQGTCKGSTFVVGSNQGRKMVLFNRVDNHDIATNSFTLSANLLSTSMVLHHSSLGHLSRCLPAPPRKQCDDALTSLHPYKHHQHKGMLDIPNELLLMISTHLEHCDLQALATSF
ncbi:hypothetical protein BJV77DRAFT_966311 [Russula vinacea]|nr:hypothetical protein BJV77DRAFT_966311 [Russula vinacea]